MTFAWLSVDVVGRRILMVGGAFGISMCFLLLTLLGGLAMNADQLGISQMAVAIPGSVTLYIATATFGIGWLSQVWLIPTEIYPSSGRAQGAAISVVIWGFANFAVTLLTPIGFNNLNYWLFLVFAVTNGFAGWWTWVRTFMTMLLEHACANDHVSSGILTRNRWTKLRRESAVLYRRQRSQYLACPKGQQWRV